MTTKKKVQKNNNDSVLVKDVDLADKETVEWKNNEPERSDMVCYILPHVAFIPYKGDEPNWFNRFMQKIFFGVVWKKRTEIE